MAQDRKNLGEVPLDQVFDQIALGLMATAPDVTKNLETVWICYKTPEFLIACKVKNLARIPSDQ